MHVIIWFFFFCWILIKLFLRVSADPNWDRDMFLCIALCPLNICDHWDLQAGKLSMWVCVWPCWNLISSHPIGMHLDGSLWFRCVLNAGIITYSLRIRIHKYASCIHVHKHIYIHQQVVTVQYARTLFQLLTSECVKEAFLLLWVCIHTHSRVCIDPVGEISLRVSGRNSVLNES